MSINPWNRRDWSNHPKLIYPDYKSTKFRNPKNKLIKILSKVIDEYVK